MADFKWTKPKERAAVLVADDLLPDSDIAAQVGIAERTLEYWKSEPAFQARVTEHVEAFRQAVLTQGIADRVNRVRRLDEDWQKLRGVVYARAKEAKRYAEAHDGKEEYPGMMSGHIVRVETDKKFGVKVEFQVDTGVLGELRALELQAAKELGQWTEKRDITSNGATVGVGMLADLSEAEIDRRIAEIEAQRGN